MDENGDARLKISWKNLFRVFSDINIKQRWVKVLLLNFQKNNGFFNHVIIQKN